MLRPRIDRRHKLDGEAQSLLLALLAEWAKPREVIAALKEAHGIEISPQTVAWYRSSPRWKPHIEDRRRALDDNVARLPISSRYWRMKRRQDILVQATESPAPDLSTARGILTDAAKELGQLKDGEIRFSVGDLNLQLVQNVLQMAPDALERYLRTGVLPAETYLSDVTPSPALDTGDSG